MGRNFLISLLFASYFFYGQNNTILDSIIFPFENEKSERKIDSLLELSEANRFANFDLCIILGKEALLQAKFIDNMKLQAISFESIGVSYYYNGLYDSAFNYYHRAMKIYQESQDNENIANCLNKIALLYTIWAQYKNALIYHQKAYQIREKLNMKLDMANSLLNLGNVYFYKTNYKKSIETYFEALLLFKKVGNNIDIALAFNNIGTVLKHINEYEAAINYLKEAELILRNAGDEKGLSRTLLNIADIYNFNLKDYARAENIYYESLELKEKSNNIIDIALVYNNLGTLYGNMKKFKQAFYYFKIAKEQYEKMNAINGLIMVNYNIGKIHQSNLEYTKAVSFFYESLNSAQEHQYVDYIGSNQLALAECYAATCDVEKFDKYFQLYNNGIDTVVDRLNRAEMLEVEAKYKYEEVDEQNKSLQEQLISQNNLANKYRNYSFGTSAILVVMLIVFALYIMFKKK